MLRKKSGGLLIYFLETTCSPEKKLRQKVAKYKNVPRVDSLDYKKKGNVGLAALETLLYLGLTA